MTDIIAQTDHFEWASFDDTIVILFDINNKRSYAIRDLMTKSDSKT